MGDSHNASALVNEITVAIRSDSCFGAIRFPDAFPHGILQWVLIYAGGCVLIMLISRLVTLRRQ